MTVCEVNKLLGMVDDDLTCMDTGIAFPYFC